MRCPCPSPVWYAAIGRPRSERAEKIYLHARARHHDRSPARGPVDDLLRGDRIVEQRAIAIHAEHDRARVRLARGARRQPAGDDLARIRGDPAIAGGEQSRREEQGPHGPLRYPAALLACAPPMASDLLLEIGCEELPASFVDGALAALPGSCQEARGLRLVHGAMRPLGTPRRIALLVEGVAGRQPDLDEEVTGPPATAAYKRGQADQGRRGVRREARRATSRRSSWSTRPRESTSPAPAARPAARPRSCSARRSRGDGRDPLPQVDALGHGRRRLRAAHPVDRRPSSAAT